MSNVKRVEFAGMVPFTFHEDAEFSKRVAFIASPVSGLKLDWTGEEFQPNAEGGRTCFLKFHVRGEEAVGFAWIEAFADDVQRLGGMCVFTAIDIEDGRDFLTGSR